MKVPAYQPVQALGEVELVKPLGYGASSGACAASTAWAPVGAFLITHAIEEQQKPLRSLLW